MISAEALIRALRDRGMSMAALADILGTERTTVYELANGAIVLPETHDRIVQAHALLGHEEEGALRFFHRFWDRTLPDGGTLRTILTVGSLDADRAGRAMDFLRPFVTGAMSRDQERREDLAARPRAPASGLTMNLTAAAMNERRTS